MSVASQPMCTVQLALGASGARGFTTNVAASKISTSYAGVPEPQSMVTALASEVVTALSKSKRTQTVRGTSLAPSTIELPPRGASPPAASGTDDPPPVSGPDPSTGPPSTPGAASP